MSPPSTDEASRSGAPLAVTMGEPAGIGGELTVRAWAARGANPDLPAFFAIDDPARLRSIAAGLDVRLDLVEIEKPADAAAAWPALPVLPQPLPRPAKPGVPSAKTAQSVVESIRSAARMCLSGAAGGMVTNPIQKQPLIDAGFAHSGHTEFLGELANLPKPPVMMLAIDGLRVVPATVHLALKDVPSALSQDLLVHTGQTVSGALRRDFGIARPRLVVAGLNPHAGESGVFGQEEQRIITPAIAALTADGIDVRGPVPADSLFHADARAGYDAAICMYHDQALIPLKTLDFHAGVNITLGLPFVRTSPDHGTALDIVGRGTADPRSFIAALKTADAMAQHRRAAQAS